MDNQITGLFLLLGGLCFIGVALRMTWSGSTECEPALWRKPIFTLDEREFYHRLRRALPDCHVFPQVSFDALLKSVPCGEQGSLPNQYCQKYAGFVICHPDTFDVVAIVELDDRTYVKEEDRKRDALLRSAGYRIERFQSEAKPSREYLSDLFGA